MKKRGVLQTICEACGTRRYHRERFCGHCTASVTYTAKPYDEMTIQERCAELVRLIEVLDQNKPEIKRRSVEKRIAEVVGRPLTIAEMKARTHDDIFRYIRRHPPLHLTPQPQRVAV